MQSPALMKPCAALYQIARKAQQDAQEVQKLRAEIDTLHKDSWEAPVFPFRQTVITKDQLKASKSKEQNAT